MSELLVTLQMQFPSLERTAIANHLAPVIEAAIAAGGTTTNLSIQPFEADEDDDY